jgi:hypothetical protein
VREDRVRVVSEGTVASRNRRVVQSTGGGVMGKVSFTYKTPTKKIGGMTIDAFLSEGYHFSNTVTDIPVEEGSIISDHVIEDQDTVDVQAFISCVEPYDDRLSLREEEFSGLKRIGKERIIAAYNELLKLKRDKTPVDIVMGLDTFHNMIITTFDIPRDVETGADLSFTMQFKHIKTVKSESAKISAAATNDQATPTMNMGLVAKETPPSQVIKEEATKLRKQGYMSDAEYKQAGDKYNFS